MNFNTKSIISTNKFFKTIVVLYFIATTFMSNLCAQIGGNNTYEFLNLNSDARIAAMGGTFISVIDNDLSTGLQNPALLQQQLNNKITLAATDYLTDIKYGSIGYARHYNKTGTFAASLKYVNYGDFTQTDEFASILGNFDAAEYALQISYGAPFQGDSAFTYGFALKGIYSKLADYTSTGLAADAGVSYTNTARLITMSLLVKNVGVQLKKYTSGAKEKLPVEVQFGISKRLGKAPFRFNLNINNMQQWDITYPNGSSTQETDPQTGEVIEKKNSFFTKAIRHCVPGIELLLSKNFHIRAAYNFQRRNELGVQTSMKAVGFNFGLGIKLSKFNFSYARSIYHLAGATNHFTVAFDMDDFYRKK